MCPAHDTITPKDIDCYAAGVLQPHLQWHDRGPKCTVTTLLQVMFYAAAPLCSLFAACRRLRDALVALCPPAETLEQQLNASFAAQRPPMMKKRRWSLAIDLHLRPYYGQAHRRAEELYRGQAKNGTTHFHADATCYLVHHGRRYTVALTRVEKGTTLVEVLKRLLRRARRSGVRPNLLLLDRGFYSVAIIRYLQAARYPFIMPAIIRGRQAAHPKGPSGTRVFALWKRSGWSTYTLTSANQHKSTVSIAVHCRNRRGQCRRHGRQTLVYAFWVIAPKTTQWGFDVYRHRFGIEAPLSPTRRGLHQNHHPSSHPAVVVCRHCAAPAQCLGLGALGLFGHVAPRRPQTQLAQVALQNPVDVAYAFG
jgi:putative transposase